MIDHIEETLDVTFDHPGDSTPAFDLAEGRVTATTKTETM